MPQMMPMEWTVMYITFLMFNIMKYFTQSPNKQSKSLPSMKEIESDKKLILNLWPNNSN